MNTVNKVEQVSYRNKELDYIKDFLRRYLFIYFIKGVKQLVILSKSSFLTLTEAPNINHLSQH